MKEPSSGWQNPQVLYSGHCELFKAAVHGLALGTAALCVGYNLAAWLCRRERHLAINAVVYGAAVLWEREHIRHHWTARSRCLEEVRSGRVKTRQVVQTAPRREFARP